MLTEWYTRLLITPQELAHLRKDIVLKDEDFEAHPIYGGRDLLTSLSITNGLEEYEEFFATIGYMTHQIANIEQDIKMSLYQLLGSDPVAVQELAGDSNLSKLLNLFELAFLAKHAGDKEMKQIFTTAKKLLQLANKFRNEAVHKDWVFIDMDVNKSAYYDSKKSEWHIVPISLLKERAGFCYKVRSIGAALDAYLDVDQTHYSEGTLEQYDILLRTLHRNLKHN